MKRPHWTACTKTVETTARVWAAKFGRRSARRETPVLTLDDLIQEGWIVAHKVMRTYDAKRGAKLETVLFIALHRHFARLLKRSLEKTFKYTAEQQMRITDYELFQRHSNPDRRKVNLIMAKIEELDRLSPADAALIRDLVTMKQDVKKIARARNRQWSIPFTQQRIDELKAVLKGAV